MRTRDLVGGADYIVATPKGEITAKLVEIRTVVGTDGKRSSSSFIMLKPDGTKMVLHSALKIKAPAPQPEPVPVSLPTPAPTMPHKAPSVPQVPLSPPAYTNGHPRPVRPLGGQATAPTLAQRIEAQRHKYDNPTTGPHLIVEARAGSGKTTTLVEGLKVVKGMRPSITPSPQQAAVWDSMALSRGKVRFICFAAFNHDIAAELRSRVPPGCDAKTMHGLGYKAVRKAYPTLGEPNEYRVSNILSALMEQSMKKLRQDRPEFVAAVMDLVGLAKQNLLGCQPTADGGLRFDVDHTDDLFQLQSDLLDLASHHDIDLNDSAKKVIEIVPKILKLCLDPSRDNCLDFDDMVWLPIALNLPMFRYDLLLVDEAQDLNRCQQAIAKRAGSRLILCGDPCQAIYGFAGADADSMPRMAEELNHTERGCMTLPLTVTRRCGKAIVREANRIVQEFHAHESNPPGMVGRDTMDDNRPTTYRDRVGDEDFVLCRSNAPLVDQCFKFIRAKRKATIRGRDIGKGLITTVEKMNAFNVQDLVVKLEAWYKEEVAKENAKENPVQSRLDGLGDRYACLQLFCEDVTTIPEVVQRIQAVFTDDPHQKGVKLSSIHKCKGLESRRVWILMPYGTVAMTSRRGEEDTRPDWQLEQEWNLEYVAITRAIEELYYVEPPPRR